MRRTKAFTLIELMVVVSIIALLAMMLVPALQRALEMTRRANCLANLKGAGTALSLYAQSYDNNYPMLPGKSWDGTVDGTGYNSKTGAPTGVAATDWVVTRSVTSLVFMLVRNGEQPKLFCCPSDSYATPDAYTTDSTNNGAYNWDFSSGQGAVGTPGPGIGKARSLSYSYECPIYGGGSGAYDLNGVPTGADASMVVMSDRTPVGNTGATTSGVSITGSSFIAAGAWASTITSDKLHLYNSPNHTSGEMMNVLYVDGHAARAGNPDCGATQNTNTNGNADCIFTANGSIVATAPQDGVDFGGVCDYTKHVGQRDTYVAGAAGK